MRGLLCLGDLSLNTGRISDYEVTSVAWLVAVHWQAKDQGTDASLSKVKVLLATVFVIFWHVLSRFAGIMKGVWGE